MASKGGTQSQITGYKYSMSIHMGIGRGPIDALREIRIGDLVAWTGSLTESGFAEIDKPDLFGGDQKEGGIKGTFKLLMGEATQIVDSIITDAMDGSFPVPGWRGVASLFYYGQIGSNNPYPKPWKMRVTRTSKGWDNDACWYPEQAKLVVDANPITSITFDSNPRSGDRLKIGTQDVGFYTVGSAPNVQIGADAAATASAFVSMLNANAALFYDVAASAAGIQVQLQFSTPVTVTEEYGNFVSIAQQGGAIEAMNPAHIIYECATNNVWGRGLPVSLIDDTAFRIAANTLAGEGFGLCIRWNRQEDIDKFVQTVVSHIGGVVYFDQRTGLLTLKLLRADYTPSALPSYGFESGIIDIVDDQSSAADTIYNEVIVKYVDPLSGKKGQVRAQNLASFQSLGTLISTTVEYLGCPTASLAMRLAQRDLQVNSSDLRRMTIVMNRQGFDIAPGGVFRIHVPSRGIDSMILRAGNIEDGPLEDETIKVTAVQDVFGMPSTSFISPQPSYWVPPDKSVRVIEDREVTELTYVDLSASLPAAELGVLETDSGFLKVFAKQPNGSAIDYVVSVRAGGESDYTERTIAGFDTVAELAAVIGHYTTAITFENGQGLAAAGAGQAILIDDEYCRVDDFDEVLGTMTIARGCIDTIPAPHTEGAKIWFQAFAPTTDFREYASGDTVNVKLLTRTSSDKLDPDAAPTDILDIGGRQGRPYPPGDMRVNGTPFGDVTVVSGDTEFTWAHRDRVTQGNFLLAHDAGSTGPEPGTTYTVRVYDAAMTLLRTVSPISGTDWTYIAATRVADGGGTPLIFEIEAVRDGLVSWQKYVIEIDYVITAEFAIAGTTSVAWDGAVAIPGATFSIAGNSTVAFQSSAAAAEAQYLVPGYGWLYDINTGQYLLAGYGWIDDG
jgi:hypothetical protein